MGDSVDLGPVLVDAGQEGGERRDVLVADGLVLRDEAPNLEPRAG